MAYRRRARSFTRKAKDWVWVTSTTQGLVAESTVAEVQLVTAGTWEANATNFERATLTRIVGWLAVQQTVAGTAGESGSFHIAIAKTGLTEAGNFNPITSGDYDTTDVLWTWGMPIGAGSTLTRPQLADTIAVDIRVKRKLDSSEKLSIYFASDSDAAAPAWSFALCLRSLINRA